MDQTIPQPPPWLYNMQRYGLPPSKPNLKVPGVNYPIANTCRYGYGINQWGKPPIVDNIIDQFININNYQVLKLINFGIDQFVHLKRIVHLKRRMKQLKRIVHLKRMIVHLKIKLFHHLQNQVISSSPEQVLYHEIEEKTMEIDTNKKFSTNRAYMLGDLDLTPAESSGNLAPEKYGRLSVRRISHTAYGNVEKNSF